MKFFGNVTVHFSLKAIFTVIAGIIIYRKLIPDIMSVTKNNFEILFGIDSFSHLGKF